MLHGLKASLGRVWLLALSSEAAVHRFVVLLCLLDPVLPSVGMQRERYNFIVFLCPLSPSFIALYIMGTPICYLRRNLAASIRDIPRWTGSLYKGSNNLYPYHSFKMFGYLCIDLCTLLTDTFKLPHNVFHCFSHFSDLPTIQDRV